MKENVMPKCPYCHTELKLVKGDKQNESDSN